MALPGLLIVEWLRSLLPAGFPHSSMRGVSASAGVSAGTSATQMASQVQFGDSGGSWGLAFSMPLSFSSHLLRDVSP